MVKLRKVNNEYFVVENGVSTKAPIEPDGLTVKLPENGSNRKWYNIARFNKKSVNNEVELEYKESIHINRSSSVKKSLEEYLNEEDKKVYLSLVEKAKKAKYDEEHKVLTPLEKAKLDYEKYKKRLDDLIKSQETK